MLPSLLFCRELGFLPPSAEGGGSVFTAGLKWLLDKTGCDRLLGRGPRRVRAPTRWPPAAPGPSGGSQGPACLSGVAPCRRAHAPHCAPRSLAGTCMLQVAELLWTDHRHNSGT